MGWDNCTWNVELATISNSVWLMNQMFISLIAPVCLWPVVRVAVFSAETAEASTFGRKRPPADEGTSAAKQRYSI